MNNFEELTIESPVFAQVRSDFDALIQKLFANMEKNESIEGSLTVKIDLKLDSEWMECGRGVQQIRRPIIGHKATISVPVQENITGKRKTGMNLVWDDDLKRYVLKYVSEGGQRSMFDPDFEENLKSEKEQTEQEPDGSNLITGPSNELPDYNGAIDAEFEEIEPDDEGYEYDDPEEE